MSPPKLSADAPVADVFVPGVEGFLVALGEEFHFAAAGLFQRSLRESLRACIVITRKQPRTSLGRDARSVLESSGLTVLSSELLYRVAYQEALAAGTGVTGRRRDAAASEVQRLFEEVEKLVYAEKKSGCYPAQALASA